MNQHVDWIGPYQIIEEIARVRDAILRWRIAADN